jgi:membrane protein
MIERLVARLERWLFEPSDSIVGKPLWLLVRVLRYVYALAACSARSA